jgi:lipopolysaccharide/colanic/teichoic acid biosynthesis glycosyltransferase
MLPKELPREKKYKHFSFGADSENEPLLYLDKKPEFVIIGADAEKVDVLMNTFEGGFALENVKSAISCFKRMAENGSVPETVIVDGKLGENAIKQVYNYLSSVAQLSSVPFLLEASHLSEAELKKYRKLAFIDEIVFLKNISGEKLLAKISFLKKVKYKALVNQPVLKTVDKPAFRLPLVFKRLFDILFASVAILLLAPFFLLIALLIKLESKGPVFYIALRAGKGYKIFKFYKFRTMIVDADKKIQQLSHLNQYDSAKEGPVFFKVSNDPRITRVGAFLRNTSLDELPQLFNVLLGDMSLVGNRPLPLYEAATLTTDKHAARFMAPAGITGLWQVKKRGNSNMSVEERINLDIDYAQKCSFVYDLWIIAHTPTALIQKENV